MSHDIPSRASIFGGGAETGRRARIKALAHGIHFHRWEESGCETELGHAWRFTSLLSILLPSYDLTTDEEANDYVCVLAKA